MGKCRFEEAINSMKGLLHSKMEGKLVSADTKELMQSKLDALALIELQVRKLQGIVRVAQVEASALTKVSTEDKLLKVVNGNVTNQKGITSIQVTSMDMLKQVSREFVELMKANRNYSGKEQEGYDEWFSILDKAGIEFKPFKLSFKKAIAGEGYGRHYTATGNIEIATTLNYGNINPRGVLLHEYMHRITADNLNKYPVLKAKTSQLMSHVKKYIKGDHYGMTNEYEFLAEVASNPKFQEELSKIPPMNKNQNILDTVKSIIKSIIDRMSNKEKSALTEGLELVIEVANEKGKDKDYSESNDISWMQEGPKVKNGKIDVTDPVASMKVVKELELQKERNRELLHMVEYPSWKAERIMEDIHNKNYRDAREMLDNIIMQAAKPGMEERAITTLLNYTLGSKEIIAGTYNIKDHVINMSTLTGEQANEHARSLVLEKYMETVYGKGAMDVEEYAVKAEELANSKEYKEVIKKEQQEEAINIVNAFIEAKGSHAVSHELVHAGAVRYMRDNPNSELTQRINELYSMAMKHEEMVHGGMGKGYWMTDVDEFLAETLTNPVTIKYMNSIKVSGSRRGPSVFDNVIATVLGMLGFKKESTVYQEVLQSYMGILEGIVMSDSKGKIKGAAEYEVYGNADANAFMQSVHDKRIKAAVGSLDSIVMRTIKPERVRNSINTLLHYTMENNTMTMGKYDSSRNRIVLSTLLEEEANSKARELAVERYIEMVYGTLDHEQAVELESKMKEDNEFMDMIEPSVKAVGAKIWSEYIENKGKHTVSHELIHAGAVVYMKDNPNSELTNRVKELYELALEKVPHAPDTYWAQNADEFLAETLTNPAIIKTMNTVKVPGKSISTTIITDLLDAVLAMLGFKKESTIYQEALNSYAGILEQVAYTKAGAELEDAVQKAVETLRIKQQLLQGMKDCK